MAPRTRLGSYIAPLLFTFFLLPAAAEAAFWTRQLDASPSEQVGCPSCSPDYFGFVPPPVRARHALAAQDNAAWITGRSQDGNSDNVLTAKYNHQGTLLWSRQWDGGADDVGMAVAVDSQGSSYVVGTTWQETQDFGPQAHLLLLKYDPNGNLLWSRTHHTGVWTWGLDLVLIDDRPHVAVGALSEDDLQFSQVLRYSPAGALEWARFIPFFGFDYEESGPAGLATDGQHLYVAGWLYKPGFPDVSDTYVAKYRGDGVRLWAVRHDSGGQDVPHGVSADSASRVFVTGQGGTAGWSGTGAPLWDAPFAGTAYGVLAQDGSVYVTGTDGRMRTVRYDAAGGDEIWTNLDDQNGVDDTGYSLALANGTLFVAGKLGSAYGDPTQDSRLFGMDSADGTPRYSGRAGSGDDRLYAIAVSPGQVWAAGDLTTSGGNTNTFLWWTDSVLPLPRLTDLKLTPINFAGGCQSPTGRITLDSAAPAGGTAVTLTNTNPAAVVPAQVIVPDGQTQVTFPVTAPTVSQVYNGVVTASAGGGTDSSSLKVRPVTVQSITLGRNPVTGPARIDASVFLECPAPAGGLEVRLASSNPAVALPDVPSILIPAGAATGRFTISVSDVTSTQYVNIRANTDGGGKMVRLQVN